MKVFEVKSSWSCNETLKDNEISPIEEFIAQIGYDSIKNIVVSAPNTINCSYYAIFYEDGMPYTPRPTPEKKGLFGR